MASVLVIEDDPVVARVMLQHLRHAGFDVEWVEDGERGLTKLRYERPDVAVIDMMLPGLDGWAVTETARRERIGTPIIAVSARGSEHDKVHTLGIGADDYLAKPFGMRELVARVQAALRRSGGMADERGATVEVEGLRIEPDQRRAFLRARRRGVDRRAADADRVPAAAGAGEGAGPRARPATSCSSASGAPVPRHRDRTVDVCVRKLREKLDRRSPTHEYLHTQYGVGYRFGAELKASAAS